MAAGHLGVQLTPGQLNEAMTRVDGYDGAEFLWHRLAGAVPGLDYRYKRIFGARTLEQNLADGLLPIVKVKYHGSGVQHWLLVVGAQNGEFMVIDPLNAQRQPMPLSTHGRVYAYRVVVPAGS